MHHLLKTTVAGQSVICGLYVLFMSALAFIPQSYAQTYFATNLAGFYSHGQVFLTWEESADTTAYYKVYRSPLPITSGAELSEAEYLGLTNSASSLNHDLSRHDGTDQFLVIGKGKPPLNGQTGLFVATTLADGAYYYAVTTVLKGNEIKQIVPGMNCLAEKIDETVATTQPVFQQTRTENYRPVEIYTSFISSKYAGGKPLMNAAGFMANSFAVYRNGAVSGKHPLRIRFHGGGADFFNNIVVTQQDEINLNPECFLPGLDHSAWWGANEHFNVFCSDSNLTPPTTGINYDFFQQQITRMINWAVLNLPVDSNRIYLEGSSLGSIGAYFYAIAYPERIAAVKINGGVFDLSFQDDQYPGCTLNAGNINRTDGDLQFGSVSSNLLSNAGYLFYDQVNGNWMTNTFKEKDYPVFYSMNGKNDTIVGWTEKTIYYQSLNTSHIGGYYFWDERTHGGGSGMVWNDDNFDIFRYSRDQAFPAFSNCSVNEDPGDGTAADGEDFGSVNGFLDWHESINDTEVMWSAGIFLHNLKLTDGSILYAPEFCTVDVTPRRRQHFKPEAGDTLWWNVVQNDMVIQSGMQVYSGGLITISQVPVYREGIELNITTDASNLPGSNQEAFLLVFPNPVSQSATIRWNMQEGGRCSLKVFDVKGSMVNLLLDEELQDGIHQVVWNADAFSKQPLATGIYFIRLETPAQAETTKIIVSR